MLFKTWTWLVIAIQDTVNSFNLPWQNSSKKTEESNKHIPIMYHYHAATDAHESAKYSMHYKWRLANGGEITISKGY